MEKSVVVEMFQKIDSQDWEGLRSLFSPDIIYERPGYPPIVGLDALLYFYREVRIIASGKHSLERIVVDDIGGASWGRFVGKHRNGVDLDERFADVYSFQNGRITRRASYFFRSAI